MQQEMPKHAKLISEIAQDFADKIKKRTDIQSLISETFEMFLVFINLNIYVLCLFFSVINCNAYLDLHFKYLN